jgi:anthranilate phosphoribosyltransferase
MVDILRRIITGQCIGTADAESTMAQMISGQMPRELVGALLASFCFQPPEGKTLAGFVRALRQTSHTLSLANRQWSDLVDVCGTGGDGHGTFNVSTSVAFLSAACGLRVAKHGNRSVSSQCGSFDVLEELGVAFAETPSEAVESLERHHLTFMYAPSFHPALHEISEIRRVLGFRTVFNTLGPLLNPAHVRRQLVGVYSSQLLIPVAEALRELGSEEVMVVCGDDGTDEISLCAPTSMVHLKSGKIARFELRPEDFGFQYCDAKDLKGGNAQENAKIIVDLFDGEKGPKRNMVVMNTAAALVVGGKAESFRAGVQLAEASLNTSRASDLLAQMRAPVAIDTIVAPSRKVAL